MTSVQFAESFKTETWTLYSVGMVGVALRFTARIRRLGIRNLQADDYLMVNAAIWYLILCVALNRVASGGGSNLMSAADIAAMTPADHDERVRGSKWVFVSEHSFLLAIWSLKSCMIVIYARLTEGLREKKLILYCAIYLGLGFVGSELALFLTCRPLSDYWAVPTPHVQCSTYQYYEIIQGCFSITADIFMLLVAIPLIIQIRLPLKQKLILLLLFGMGIFVIVSAVLTKVYCLVPSLISYVYMNWYFREVTVAILVTNLPMVWTLLREVVPGLSSWLGGSKRGTDAYRAFGSSLDRRFGTKGTQRYGQMSAQHRSMYDMQDFDLLKGKDPSSVSVTGQSSEQIDAISDDGSEKGLGIRKNITVTVKHDIANSPIPPTRF